MKVIPIALATHMAQGTTTLCHLLTIVRTDGYTLAFTSHVEPLTIDDVVYESTPGLTISNLDFTSTLSVDNLELTILNDLSIITMPEVLGGIWRNAAFSIQRCNYKSVADGVETLANGTIGDLKIERGSVVVELRGLQQYLQQSVGNVTTKTCRARLGDSMCTVALLTYTFGGSVTSVTSQQVFRDSTKAQAADYFAEGVITFTSGPLTGFEQKIKAFEGGVFTLSLPMYQTIDVGTTFMVSAGCRKRLAEDCFTKFNNVLNFQGEPHLPGIDVITAQPDFH